MADDLAAAREWAQQQTAPTAPQITGGVTAGVPEAKAAPAPSSAREWAERQTAPRETASQAAPTDRGNWLTAGVRTGWNELQGLSDYAIAMGAGTVGAKDTQQEYIKAAQQQLQEAQQYNRPELELAPWQEGWKLSNLPAQIGYQAAKQIPMMAATMGAGGVVGGALERAGIQALPKFAASGLSTAVEDVTGKQVAAEAIQKAAQPVATTTAASYPLSAGSVYQEQVEKGDLSPQAAITSSALAVPHALLESFEIGQLKNIFARGMPSKAAKTGLLDWLKGTAVAGAKATAGESVAEGAQATIEQSVRTDLTPAQKADTILQSAFMGGIAGFGLGGGAHIVGSALSPTKTVRPENIDTPALKTIVDTALNPQTAQQKLDAAVEASTAPQGAAQPGAERVEPTMSGLRQGPPGPGEVAIEVSPEDRIRGGVEPAAETLRQTVAPEAAVQPARTEIPEVPQAPLSTARSATPLPNAPLSHIEDAQLAEMFRQATNPQVKAEIRKEMETRLAPAQPEIPVAPTFEQTQQTARKDFIESLGLTGQAAKEAQKLDITHPMEAVPLVQAKIAERVKKGQALTQLQQRMNERYGLVDAENKPLSIEDLQAAQQREQLTAETAPNRLVREDAEYRAKQFGDQITNRQAVEQYVASAAERPARPAPAPAEYKPSGAEIRRAAKDAINALNASDDADQKVPSRFETQFNRGFAAGVSGGNRPFQKFEGRGYDAGKAFVEQNAPKPEAAPTAPETPTQTPSPGPAIWANRDFDMPVEIIGRPEAEPAEDGRYYQRVRTPDGYENFVPADELRSAERSAASTAQTFKTAKGSTYTINSDGTTTRDKAARPEHPGEEGIQPPSQRTVYMTEAESNKLAEIQAQGGPRKTLTFDDATGTVAIKYLEGKDAGKVERRTVAKYETEPKVGLHPVEYFGDNYTPHFGNKITELGQTQLTETLSAIQEPSAEGVYVQPTPETRGTVGEGNAEERQAPGARVEQQVGQAPEITERPTRQIEQSVNDMSAPATPDMGYAGRTQEDVGVSRMTDLMQKAEAYSTTLWNQVERFGKVIPALKDLWKASTLRDSFEAQLAQIAIAPMDRFSQLVRKTPASAERIQAIAREARNGIDARKPWAAHTWLQNKPDVADYKQRHEKVRQQYFELQRAGHDKIFNDLVDLNTTMWQLTNNVLLYNSLRTQFKNNPQLAPAFNQRLQRLSPITTYLESASTRDLATTAQHFNQLHEQLRQLAGDYTRQYPNDINSPELAKGLSELDHQQREYKQAPYFHLGRSGEHSVKFQLPILENGLVDKAAADKIVKALSDKGYNDYEISPLGTDPNVFLMTQSIEQRQEMADIIRATGLVKTVTDLPIAGAASQNAAPRVLQEVINRLQAAQEADPEANRLNAQMVRTLQKYAGDMLGENDARKSLIRRKNIEGFDKNIIGSMAEDIEGRIRMIGRLAGTPSVLDSISSMRAQAKNAGDVASPDYKNRDLINTIASQRQRFESEVGLTPANPVVTFLTGLNYTRNMGLNVSSAALQLFQLYQLLGPTLMMRPGVSYAKAYKAIATATGPAFKVMQAIANEATSQRTLQQWFDAPLTTQSIENSGLSANQKKFLILYNNMYGAGSNSLARELGHLWNEHEYGINAKSVFGTAQKMSTSMVYYSELFSRITAALAAYEAYAGDKTSPEGLRAVVEYAGEVNSRAMYDYSQSNVSQLMSRAGPLGQATPLAGAFLKFQAMFSESFMLNAGRALGIDNYSNPEQQAAARRFMAGYLASTITLAGVLGLPAINALAPGWDKLMDVFDPDNEPHDIRSQLIKFIGDMTGRVLDDATANQITRALVEGVPAVAGTPLQSRVGMQDVIPFTKTVWDSPKPVKDRVWDVFKKTGGSPIESLVDMVDGVFKMADGEVEAGVKSIAGSPAKNIINAWRMMEDGKFRDSQGKVLPIEDATVADALRRLVGFSSTKEYEYQMERAAMDRREKPLGQDAARIVNGLARSRQDNDIEAYDDYLGQARDYQRLTGENLVKRGEKLYKRRQTELRTAQRAGTPLRAPKKDRGLGEALEGYRELRELP